MVNDVAHVSFVDSHAEGDGSNDDMILVALPLSLDVRSLLGSHACVVVIRTDTKLLEFLRDVFATLARQTVDDAGLLMISLLDQLCKGIDYALDLWQHLI